MTQRTLPWQPMLGSKLPKLEYSPLFVALVFRNELQYCHSDFKKFICDDLATSYVNLVNFGPVAPAFNRVVGVHRTHQPSKLAKSAYSPLFVALAFENGLQMSHY